MNKRSGENGAAGDDERAWWKNLRNASCRCHSSAASIHLESVDGYKRRGIRAENVDAAARALYNIKLSY